MYRRFKKTLLSSEEVCERVTHRMRQTEKEQIMKEQSGILTLRGDLLCQIINLFLPPQLFA